MLVNSTRPIPPEHHLPPYQAREWLDDLHPEEVARYYKNLSAQRQKIKKVIEEAIPKQKCKGAEQLALILRKFHKI